MNKPLTLTGAIELQKHIYPLGEYEYSPMINKARKHYREEIGRLYDHGYGIIHINGGHDE